MPRYYEIEASLMDVTPRIWRRFQVRDKATLKDLHDALQTACGWCNSHLASFSEWPEQGSRSWPKPIAQTPYMESFDEGDDEIPDADDVPIADHLQQAGDRILYTYDFGDNWEHEVKLLRIFIDTKDVFKRQLIDGARAFPPEDCGSIPGYEELVVAFDNESELDEEQEGKLGWLRSFDPDWAPERFDLTAVKKAFDRKR